MKPNINAPRYPDMGLKIDWKKTLTMTYLNNKIK